MRILFVATIVPYPPHGGVYQRTFNILKQIAAVHEVTFVGFEKTESDPKNAEHIREFCHEVYTYRLPDDWRKSAYFFGILKSIMSAKPYTCQKYHLDEVARLIQDKIRKRQIDALHVDICDLATYGDYSLEIPKVLTHHNINSQLWASQAKAETNVAKKCFMLLQSLKFKRIERKYVPKYDINVAVSPLEEKQLKEIVPADRVRLVPNGVDVDYFIPADPELENRREVIYAGSPEYYPNAVAIKWWCEKVVPLLRRCGVEDVRLTLLGSTEKATGKVMKYIQNDANNNLHAPGFVDDIRPYVAKASVYVVPLQSGGGTRLKVLDALAMGKAVVSTSVGCEGISVTHGKDILIADSPEEFVRALTTLFEDKDLRLTLGQNGRRLVEEVYSWERICQDMLNIYPGLLDDLQSRKSS